jgi:hypothetical protein
VLALLVVACSSGHEACSDSCIEASSATFNLACNPNDLVSVTATGPCANPEAGLSWYTGAATKWSAAVFAQSPGTCHIELTFATGFTYATDVTFVAHTANCGCPTYLGPEGPGGFEVQNPADTCRDE